MAKGLKEIYYTVKISFHPISDRILDFLNNCFFYLLKEIGIVLFKVFYRIRAVNREIIPAEGPLIVAANHFSYMDPVVLQLLFPRRIFFMMTEKFYEGRGKWLFRVMRCICVREKGANIAAIRAGVEALERNQVIGIFPEGAVSSDGRIHEGNQGIGFLVMKTRAPVIPVFVSGTYEALPKGKKIPRINRIKVIFGKPVIFKNMDRKPDKKKITEITNQIMGRIKELSISVQ